MIIKLIGCVFVMIAAIGIGITAGNERKKYLRTLIQINNIAFLIQGDIRYSHTPMIEALLNASLRHNGSLKDFLRKVSERLVNNEGITFYTIWSEETDIYIKKSKSENKIREVLMNFGKCFDAPDIEMKITSLEGFIREEERSISSMRESENEKVRLYRNLGILGGVFIIVLLF